MHSPKLSIIVPVYNSSEFIKKCIDSIINQTLNDIEIIIVNDCSPDSLDDVICSHYERADSRIFYIKHSNNLGLGGARNSGMRIARGEYIWFIDSDDFIDINSCEFLYKLAIKKQSDIIAFSAVSHVNYSLDLSNNKHYYYIRDVSVLDKSLSGHDFMELALLCNSLHVSACLHLFKREYIKTYEFRENVIHEDTDLIPVAIYNADSIYCTKYAPYYRLLRNNSISRTKVNEKVILDRFACVDSLYNYYVKYSLPEQSPLLAYIVREFNFVKNLYGSHNEKTTLTEKAYEKLVKNYSEVPIEPSKQFEADWNLGKKYLLLKKEVETIKKSKFWKVSSFFRELLKQKL